MQAQPLIAVADVEAASRWYQAVLGCHGTHGGTDYEQLAFDGRIILQLHRWDAQHHAHVGDPACRPYGNGVLLWFWTDDFDDAVDRAAANGAKVVDGPKENRNAQHRELWLNDPDGYVVVIAGPYGDVGM
ncbi:glyoxalase/bleomycin resistance protein/dioxygenase superfamily protein [Pseudoduganella lurida]|uniref:Glyoxalase/bleomycin resistance protein/dioxygenase superfamily protein n=1 Tax=Pseudoduganella lurida TaxID=1036180 RepID=A0A562RC26_9BURK|nr:VOC family protein [Pseudoduganella lurida]TWI66601.1 glyoxalase/bleomycin resistance protein/dioxygenase superfamily protein [Pseudoduganella lurida]